MKLQEIHEQIINEAAKGPLAAFEYIIKAAGKGMNEANGALLKAVQRVNPSIKLLSKATPEEINKALTRVEFKEYRQIISNSILVNQKKEIDKILTKFDLTNSNSIKQAKAEIANKLGIKNAFANDIVNKQLPKNSKIKPKITPNKSDDLTYWESFLKGAKSQQSPFLFTKAILRNQPLFKSYFKKRYPKLTDDEIKRVWVWFFSGIGDANLIKNIFIKNGLPKALVNLGGQVFAKWLFWSFVFSAANLAIDLTHTLGEKVYPNDLEAFKGRFEKNAESASIHWIFPVWVLWTQVVSPLFQGGITSVYKKNVLDRWEQKKRESENELKKIVNSSDSSNITNKIKKEIPDVLNKVKPDIKSDTINTTRPKMKFNPNF